MYRASGNGKSHAVDSVDDDAEDAPLSPFSHVVDDLELFVSFITQVAQGTEVFENGQAAEAFGKVLPERREKRVRDHSARKRQGKEIAQAWWTKEPCVEEKGDAEDNEKTDYFYQEALDEFKETVAGRPDATIFWENLGKAQRHRIVIFCEERGLVATEWPHKDAASGKVVVSSEAGPAPRGGDVKGKNRKR
jgi:hypothetical protein